MKLYKTTITPLSNFATTIKGDTLFGQICWAIRYNFGEEKLKSLLSDYKNAPFLVVSDGFATGYVPKPKIPTAFLKEDSSQKKENRKKIWLTMEALKEANYHEAKTDQDIQSRDKESVTVRNSIHYKTFATSDGGEFAPFGAKEYFFDRKDIYFLLDTNKFSPDALEQSFRLLSESGYGKDATIGKGRFRFDAFEEITYQQSTTTYMTLSPFSPEGIVCKKLYYEPFVRFGKFGGERAYKNAFKKPLILADTASVVVFEDSRQLAYIGKAITGISDLYDDAVHQGYSIVLPMKEFL